MTIPTTTTTKPAPTTAGRNSNATAEAEAAQKHRDRHAFRGMKRPDRMPVVLPVDANTVRVELFGRHAAGRFFTIDRDVWERVEQDFGSQWLASPRTTGESKAPETFFVSSGRREAVATVHQPAAKARNAVLARLITGAQHRQVVSYRDHDWTNLRLSNLVVLSKAEAGRRGTLLRQAKLQAEMEARLPQLMASLRPRATAAAQTP
jgi:hypothetical protein